MLSPLQGGANSPSWRIAGNGVAIAVVNADSEPGSVESATSVSRSNSTIDNTTPRAANTPSVRPSTMNIVEPSVGGCT
jgi:hypothetical protein